MVEKLYELGFSSDKDIQPYDAEKETKMMEFIHELDLSSIFEQVERKRESLLKVVECIEDGPLKFFLQWSIKKQQKKYDQYVTRPYRSCIHQLEIKCHKYHDYHYGQGQIDEIVRFRTQVEWEESLMDELLYLVSDHE